LGRRAWERLPGRPGKEGLGPGSHRRRRSGVILDEQGELIPAPAVAPRLPRPVVGRRGQPASTARPAARSGPTAVAPGAVVSTLKKSSSQVDEEHPGRPLSARWGAGIGGDHPLHGTHAVGKGPRWASRGRPGKLELPARADADRLTSRSRGTRPPTGARASGYAAHDSTRRSCRRE